MLRLQHRIQELRRSRKDTRKKESRIHKALSSPVVVATELREVCRAMQKHAYARVEASSRPQAKLSLYH